MMISPVAVVVTVVAILALMAPAAPAAPVPATTTVIRVTAPTRAMTEPVGGSLVLRLDPEEEFGGPTHLRVLETRTLEDGTLSYKVLLNRRPNGSTGWVQAGPVQVLSSTWAIVIDLSERKVKAFNNGTLVRARKAVVGAKATPTPRGEFYLVEKVKRPAGEFTGNWIVPFAYSNVLEQFAGGPGRVALHGRGGKSLDTPLGTAASHGCVRMNNADIAWIAQRMPLGTPIRVQA